MIASLLLVFLSVAGVARGACVQCEAAVNGTAICADGWQTSLYENGECVFDSRVEFKNVFVTASVFSFGMCLAVTSKISHTCFENMAGQVAERLKGSSGAGAPLSGCETHMLYSPCEMGEAKYTAHTAISTVADCAILDILYADAMEECLRYEADGRFWAGFGYIMAILVGIAMVGGGCAGCAAFSIA